MTGAWVRGPATKRYSLAPAWLGSRSIPLPASVRTPPASALLCFQACPPTAAPQRAYDPAGCHAGGKCEVKDGLWQLAVDQVLIKLVDSVTQASLSIS